MIGKLKKMGRIEAHDRKYASCISTNEGRKEKRWLAQEVEKEELNGNRNQIISCCLIFYSIL